MFILHKIGLHQWHFVRKNDIFKCALWICICGKTKYVDDILNESELLYG